MPSVVFKDVLRATVPFIPKHSRFKSSYLRRHFNRQYIAKPGLYQPVHVVDKEGLMRIAAGSQFNENLFLKSGRDKKFPEFLQIEPFPSVYFMMCDEGGRFVASATLRPEAYRQSEMIISQISIHPDYHKKGYATRLLLEIAHYLNHVRPDVTRLIISRFMPMGHRYLRHKFIEIAHVFKAETFEIYQETHFEKLKNYFKQLWRF